MKYGRTQKMRQTVSATWVRCFDDDGGVGRVVTILTSKAPSLKRPSVLSLRQKCMTYGSETWDMEAEQSRDDQDGCAVCHLRTESLV